MWIVDVIFDEIVVLEVEVLGLVWLWDLWFVKIIDVLVVDFVNDWWLEEWVEWVGIGVWMMSCCFVVEMGLMFV